MGLKTILQHQRTPKGEQTIISANDNKQELNRDDIGYEKGRFSINNTPYEKLIRIPDPTRILQMPQAELNEILNTKVYATNSITIDKNMFIAYSIFADNPDQVQRAYMNIKLANAGARHVVAVWSIPGLEEYRYEDFQDDEEYGAGAAILSALQQSQIMHRAVFVVRYVGDKLQDRRIPTYIIDG